jgi:hypothetical protein
VAGDPRSTTLINEEDTFGAGLTNTIDPSIVTDPRAAVQFDRYTSFGLAAGSTDTFDVRWFFGHYGGLSLTPPSGSQSVGQQQSVTAVFLDHGQAVGGAVIRYAVTGANASSGSVSTAANGSATIRWLGSHPGQDTLTAYVDNDDDGTFDPAIDTQQTATFSWAAPPPPPPPSSLRPSPPPPPPEAPSNAFAVIAAKADARGIITLTLRAPVAGAFRAVATSRRSARRTYPYGSARATASSPRTVKLKISPTLAAKRRITNRRLKITVAMTFTPTGGTAKTKHRILVVKAKRHR